MKIVKIEPLNDGMPEVSANNLFDKIENFAKYSFNASHSVAYSVVSYWTAWLKVYYPAEYFAAQLSIVKEDKFPALVKDARSCGIEVVPPDINLSTDKFEIKNDETIVMPFSSVKGCSEVIAKKIMNARMEAGGRFTSKAHFEEFAKKRGSGINVRVVGNLDLVGAFAGIEPTQPKATAEERLKDQSTLLPGLIIDTISSSSVTVMNEAKKLEILSIHSEVVDCKACNLCDKVHPLPVVGGAKCRYMVVFDNPSTDEEADGKMMKGKGAGFVKQALKECGVSPAQGYYTSLVKAKKDDKFLTNTQINGCSKFLDKEVETVKPGVIVCLGSSAVKHFLPDVKPASEIGNAYYVPALDATVVVGFNPSQLFFNPSKYEALKQVFAKTAEALGIDSEEDMS